MKKIKWSVWHLFLVFLILPVFWSLLRPGYFFMQDDLQAFRVQQMNKCLTDFQIPCRWIADGGYGYGYPQFNYYPPLPYYLGALIHRMGFQYIDSVKILFILGYILSALTMFVLVKEIVGKWEGFVSALLYTYIPYKAVEVYVRGALSEFWAQIFFPLIFLFIYKLIKTRKIKFIFYLGISIACLVTTHALMTIIFILPAVLWTIYWLFEFSFKKEILIKLFYSGLLGFSLSAYFLLPIVFERNLVHIESMLSGYFDYRQHFVSLYKLFVSREWGYGSSGFPNEKLNLSLGVVQWIVAVVAGILATINYRKNKKIFWLVFLILLTTLFSVFMIHLKSSFIWAKLPFLWYMQFPWRFLALSIFLLSFLSAYFLYFFKGFGKYLIGAIIVAASVISTINYFSPKEWYFISDADKFSGINWQKQITISIFDYLPKTAVLPPINKAPDFPEVLEGRTDFLSYKKGSSFQNGKIKVYEDSTIRLPIIDFAGMALKVNGQDYKYVNNDCRYQDFCYGLVTFKIPKGEYDIEVKLKNTFVRKIGNYLTFISLLVIAVYVFRKNKKINSK